MPGPFNAPAERLLQPQGQPSHLEIQSGERLAGALRPNIITEFERGRGVESAKHRQYVPLAIMPSEIRRSG